MTYLNQLYPWCIIKPLPNLQRLVVGRFRRRNEAEAHLQVISRLVPNVTYSVVFDPMPDREDTESNSQEDTESDRSVAEET
jgi:hypothetical protein